VDANPRADGERFASGGKQLQRDIERTGAGPSRAGHGDVAALELGFVDADQRERGTTTRAGVVGVVAVYLNRAHADFAIQREQSHRSTGATLPLQVDP